MLGTMHLENEAVLMLLRRPVPSAAVGDPNARDGPRIALGDRCRQPCCLPHSHRHALLVDHLADGYAETDPGGSRLLGLEDTHEIPGFAGSDIDVSRLESYIRAGQGHGSRGARRIAQREKKGLA